MASSIGPAHGPSPFSLFICCGQGGDAVHRRRVAATRARRGAARGGGGCAGLRVSWPGVAWRAVAAVALTAAWNEHLLRLREFNEAPRTLSPSKEEGSVYLSSREARRGVGVGEVAAIVTSLDRCPLARPRYGPK